MYKNLCVWALALPGSEYMVDETTLKKTLQLAKTTGYEGIEVSIEAVSKLVQEKSVDYVKNLFSEAKIIPAGWGLPDGFAVFNQLQARCFVAGEA